MGQLIDAFYSLYPENHQRRCYLFLDRVQNIPGCSTFFDSKNVQVYLTGSSAKLLSKEINTSLRGRSLSFEVLPHSFQEYLSVHEVPLVTKPFGRAAFDVMYQHLVTYFSVGGFLGVQDMKQHEWRETLQGYIDTVILKDIIERHNVSNITLLNYLAKTIIKNTACVFSVNKFYNDIKSQGFHVSKDTIHAYLNHLEDAFLTFTMPFYTESERLKQNRPKKIYTIDSGLMNAVTMSASSNVGHLLENLIYFDLRRKNKNVYFYHTTEGCEIGFVTVDPDGTRELIQVAWDVTDDATIQREQRALHQAEKELGITGRFVTAWSYLRESPNI